MVNQTYIGRIHYTINLPALEPSHVLVARKRNFPPQKKQYDEMTAYASGKLI